MTNSTNVTVVNSTDSVKFLSRLKEEVNKKISDESVKTEEKSASQIRSSKMKDVVKNSK